MIEIIQEENWNAVPEDRGLPKNVKQVGTPETGSRIYIENEAYQKMHPYGSCPERMVYVLMGHFDNYGGYDCTFIDDVVEMQEIEFHGNLPMWTDESWAYLYRKLLPEHDNMVIVGWAVDICGQVPSITAQLEHMHQSYFGGKQQVLMLLDSLEREETFYGNQSGYLKRKAGFFICYKNVLHQREDGFGTEYDQDAVFKEQEAHFSSEEEFSQQESYRDYLNRQNRNGTKHKKAKVPKPQNQGSYVSTVLLLLVIAALGYSAIQNQKKADEIEEALAQISQLQTNAQTGVGMQDSAAGSDDETIIRVEEIIGSVTPDTSLPETTERNNGVTETDTAQSTQNSEGTEGEIQETEQAATVLSEAEIYLNQGYYIVQQGDSLAGICRKIYHTSAMLNELCSVNAIENPDAIYAGQYLKLP